MVVEDLVAALIVTTILVFVHICERGHRANIDKMVQATQQLPDR